MDNTFREPTHPMLDPLPGFDGINRYWDKYHGKYVAKILPGECYVTVNDELVATVLGSCVSACIRDKVFGIGGMNHFMLPSSGESRKGSWLSEANRYGNFAMEYLINEILKNGGERRNLEIKLFGGGKIVKNMSNVGKRNIEFVIDYLKTESLHIETQNLGDIYPRKVIYFPMTGRAKMKKLQTMHNDTIIRREVDYSDSLIDKPVSGDVELF